MAAGKMGVFSALLILGVFSACAWADTPANCTYEDIKGTWTFSLGPGGNTRDLDCTNYAGQGQKAVQVTLSFPDLAVDQFGNVGFWTIVYNQGFEVVVGGRKYFAFSKYKEVGKVTTSICDEILPGYSHDVLENDWACYTGKKTTASAPKVSHKKASRLSEVLRFRSSKFYNDMDFISKINSVQSSWRAAAYPHLEGRDLNTLMLMAGGPASRVAGRPRPAPVSREVYTKAAQLPKEHDWRNVDGVDFVSPVRNQGGCGSCYAFASMAMNEARVRIMTNNTQKPVFSPQDIVECSKYSQGCAGGFPYLIGGKYAEDYGLVLEADNPYTGIQSKTCNTAPKAKRYYSTSYQYVGGYYGACNEPLMRQELYENGPLAVGFEVLPDFAQYKGGIYHHTGLTGGFEPFELTNHAVLLVGYGEDKTTGEMFWIVKNSWGEEWGEKGYFRIRRGTDEVAFESMAVQATPIISL